MLKPAFCFLAQVGGDIWRLPFLLPDEWQSVTVTDFVNGIRRLNPVPASPHFSLAPALSAILHHLIEADSARYFDAHSQMDLTRSLMFFPRLLHLTFSRCTIERLYEAEKGAAALALV